MTEEQLKKRLEDLTLAKGKSVINTHVLNGQILEVEQWLNKIEKNKGLDKAPEGCTPKPHPPSPEGMIKN